MNSRSLRTPEYAAEKPSDVSRIVALGDSFTFASGGVPFPDLWHTRLGHELEQRWGRDVEVINLAMPGVGPQFQLRMWQIEGRRLDPDLVLVAFFVGNDFRDDVAPVGSLRTVQGITERMASASYVARIIRNLVRLRGASTTNGAPPVVADPNPRSSEGGYEITSYRDRYDPMRPALTEDEFLAMEGRRASISRADRESAFRRLFGQASTTLKQLADEIERSGAKMLVLVIPDSFQVEEDLFTAILTETESRRADYDLDRPQRALAEFFEANSIEYLDLLEPFRDEAQSRRLYKFRDSHWNQEGNRVASDLLIERLAPERP